MPESIGDELRFPPLAHRASVDLGDRLRGRSVENAPGPVRFSNGAAGRDGAVRGNIARFNVKRHH
ncbi:MAG: hypothetical protein OXI79_10255, partial [Gammaproteobacteria bacterium]|nr:hypothetical protein [Gammaproteobacteria bacterium]